jgi:hypothetical protein
MSVCVYRIPHYSRTDITDAEAIMTGVFDKLQVGLIKQELSRCLELQQLPIVVILLASNAMLQPPTSLQEQITGMRTTAELPLLSLS